LSEQENVKVVKELFQAFERDSIEDVLDIFADDVDFQSPVTGNAPPEISWAKHRYGREDVAAFFQEISEQITVDKIEMIDFTAQDDKVVVEGRNHGIVKSTGSSYKHDWVMVFNIKDGKIIRNRHYYDTADIVTVF
jgi:ketosteroid isomerase-like protein